MTEARHPSTEHVLQFFAFDHLANDELRQISGRCHDLAFDMADDLPSSPELTTGLRKLLEAKDCFVRAWVAEHGSPGPNRPDGIVPSG